MRMRRGFSLVELLVVVAILSLLLVILTPSLSRAKRLAQDVACLSNQHQIVTAHSTYTTAYQGYHPPSSTDPTQPHWLDLMARYAGGSDDVRFCPAASGYLVSDPDQTTQPQVWGSRRHHWWLNRNTYTVEASRGGSYGANSWLHSTSGWGSPIALHFRHVGEVSQGPLTPVVTDSVWHNGFPRDSDTPSTVEAYGGQPPGGMMGRVAVNRHRGAIHAGFADGSSTRVELIHLWGLVWHRDFRFIPLVEFPWPIDD
ncbi:MAG: hypothetical protein BWX88_02809 [Planctomycetes bacterium ADurb.Bin126]|nr:MAG: hypothetical protein BWX88_02809 [Planctomycetes bacterium ADurb.Bin126]HOD79907.1 type II secretion system protein [Phycisphaerae bacterium]HQL73278.1 type II secretion system protein [Phycisphaerae bacterium]